MNSFKILSIALLSAVLSCGMYDASAAAAAKVPEKAAAKKSFNAFMQAAQAARTAVSEFQDAEKDHAAKFAACVEKILALGAYADYDQDTVNEMMFKMTLNHIRTTLVEHAVQYLISSGTNVQVLVGADTLKLVEEITAKLASMTKMPEGGVEHKQDVKDETLNGLVALLGQSSQINLEQNRALVEQAIAVKKDAAMAKIKAKTIATVKAKAKELEKAVQDYGRALNYAKTMGADVAGEKAAATALMPLQQGAMQLVARSSQRIQQLGVGTDSLLGTSKDNS